MIDIENVEKEFNNYISNYDPTNDRIKLKINHIKRVAENCKYIALKLNLTNEQIALAQAIGYFHDIGRFEQVRIANTFSDKESGINHGELSVKVLFENNLIRKFIPENKYDNIIKESVINHNKARINPDLKNDELLFSKIIRDADKLDILYNINLPESTMEAIFWYEDFDNLEKINNDLIIELKENFEVDYSKIENNADVILIFYAFIFDLYFPHSLKIISDKKYLDSFTKRVLEKFKSPIIHEQTKDVLSFCNNYINKNLPD